MLQRSVRRLAAPIQRQSGQAGARDSLLAIVVSPLPHMRRFYRTPHISPCARYLRQRQRPRPPPLGTACNVALPPFGAVAAFKGRRGKQLTTGHHRRQLTALRVMSAAGAPHCTRAFMRAAIVNTCTSCAGDEASPPAPETPKTRRQRRNRVISGFGLTVGFRCRLERGDGRWPRGFSRQMVRPRARGRRKSAGYQRRKKGHQTEIGRRGPRLAALSVCWTLLQQPRRRCDEPRRQF